MSMSACKCNLFPGSLPSLKILAPVFSAGADICSSKNNRRKQKASLRFAHGIAAPSQVIRSLRCVIKSTFFLISSFHLLGVVLSYRHSRQAPGTVQLRESVFSRSFAFLFQIGVTILPSMVNPQVDPLFLCEFSIMLVFPKSSASLSCPKGLVLNNTP